MSDFIFPKRSNHPYKMAAPVVHLIQIASSHKRGLTSRVSNVVKQILCKESQITIKTSDRLNEETTTAWATWNKSAGIEMSQ